MVWGGFLPEFEVLFESTCLMAGLASFVFSVVVTWRSAIFSYFSKSTVTAATNYPVSSSDGTFVIRTLKVLLPIYMGMRITSSVFNVTVECNLAFCSFTILTSAVLNFSPLVMYSTSFYIYFQTILHCVLQSINLFVFSTVSFSDS